MSIKGILEAVKGCQKEEIRMDVIANNLANSAVPGFKRDRVSFQNFLTQAISASLVRIKVDMAQGDLRFTGNQLDLAINGPGFFKVNTPDGIRYTRKGNFNLDAAGNLVTSEGYSVLGKGGAINIGKGMVSVDEVGRILVDGEEVDQVDIVTFTDPSGLIKTGEALFKKPEALEEEAIGPETAIRQGYIEGSNVNVAEEMVQMIHSLRAFESYQRALKTLDHLDNKATNEVARLR